MWPNSEKWCIKMMLKLDVTIACPIEMLHRFDCVADHGSDYCATVQHTPRIYTTSCQVG